MPTNDPSVSPTTENMTQAHEAAWWTRADRRGTATAVVGLQWGDEGKGKIVDVLAGEHSATVRYNGGANAGHSVVVGGERYALHLVPSGVLHKGSRAVIGNGVVVDPAKLIDELDGLAQRDVDISRLVVSSRAHVVLPYHMAEDALRERVLAGRALPSEGADPAAVREIGTTRRGIGPAYAEKVNRASAVRMGDLLRPNVLREKVALACTLKNALLETMGETERFDAGEIVEHALTYGDRLRAHITDTAYLLNDMLGRGEKLLFEGANATLLDVDHGTFPFVTSSTCSALGIGPGTGLSPAAIGRVIGVAKAYSTRVGGGPMPTELDGPIAEGIRERGREYGTTTGRPRRVGWLDLVALRYAVMINGATEIALMLLDVLGGMDEVHVCTAYEIDGARTEHFPPDGAELARAMPVFETLAGFAATVADARSPSELPAEAIAYVERIERAVGVPVRTISVGPDRSQTIVRSA